MPGTEWVLVSRCPSVGHAELLLRVLRSEGLGGEIRGPRLADVEGAPADVWVQACGAVLPIERR